MIIGSMETELVAGLIIRDRRLLLVRNAKYSVERIEPPGGKVEAGETREGALVREVTEETGLTVQSQSYFGAYKTDSPEGTFTVYTYLCVVAGGEPEVREPEKTPEVGWYTIEELEELSRGTELAPNMKAAMGKIIELLG
ncbi:MAG: NUDIX hydrolase [Proteobacteria bacterium]|nr:NUDIX hydrolase [Pseudomonadota bacterium]